MVKLRLPREQVENVLAKRIRAGEELVGKEEVAERAGGYYDWISLFTDWRDQTIAALTAAYDDRRPAIEFELETATVERSSSFTDFPYKRKSLGRGIQKLRDVFDRLDLVGEPKELPPGPAITDPGASSTGAAWADLDTRIVGMSSKLIGAASRDDIQEVGRRAREVLIDCAQLIADPSLVPEGQPLPKAGDAKAWLELFLAARAGGSSREELRRLVRAAWDLAQKVTHGDPGRVDAFAAAQATVLVVRTLQELALAPDAEST
jgi:hypothetical protein